MTETLEKRISHYFMNGSLSKEKLVSFIKADFPNWSNNTINMYLSRLKKKGKISTSTRGMYQLESTRLFEPNISVTLKKIHHKLKNQFPYISFCVWDSIWLNDLMLHQRFKHYLIVEVEKDASESVFGFLSQTYKNVFLHPKEELFDRYINVLDGVIIVKNLISEAPLTEVKQVSVPALEKLLVDMLIDKNLFYAQQNELEFIFARARDKYEINEGKLRRYAIRRNRAEELKGLINIISAK